MQTTGLRTNLGMTTVCLKCEDQSEQEIIQICYFRPMLTKTRFYRQMSVKAQKIKFHQISRVIVAPFLADGQKDRHNEANRHFSILFCKGFEGLFGIASNVDEKWTGLLSIRSLKQFLCFTAGISYLGIAHFVHPVSNFWMLQETQVVWCCSIKLLEPPPPPWVRINEPSPRTTAH